MPNNDSYSDRARGHYNTFFVTHGWGMSAKITEDQANYALESGLAVEVIQYSGDVLFIVSEVQAPLISYTHCYRYCFIPCQLYVPFDIIVCV